MQFNPRVLRVADYPSAGLVARKQELSRSGQKVYDFSLGDPIEPTPEFIRNAVCEGVPLVSQYPTVKGSLEQREAIQNYIKRRFGVELNMETEILPCSGSREAIYNLPFMFISSESPKNVIIGPAPGYLVMEKGAVMSGAEYYPFELTEENGYLLELGTLPPALLERTAIAWINYPHNPTGIQCDLAYMKRQVDVCRKYDILLCSDECYVDQYYTNIAPPSVLEVTTQNVLAFHSCSKRSGMTAYRSGFIAGDAAVMKLYAAFRNSLGNLCPPYTAQAAIRAWNDDKHAEERRQIFAAKRQVLLEFFNEIGVKTVKSNAAIYIWAECPNGMRGTEYMERLISHGIIVSPGEFFGTHCDHYFRVALVPSKEQCMEAIQLWRNL